MVSKSWIVTDVDQSKHQSDLVLSSEDLGIPGGSIGIVTHQAGLQQGVQTIEVGFGECRAILIPTRGMNVWKAWAGEQAYGWDSPIDGPVHPAFVPVMEHSGLGWLDGFDELFVRCGLESNGAPEHDDDGRLLYPLHGKIGNKPARFVSIDVEGDTITVTGVVRETRFHFLKMELTTKTIFNTQSKEIKFNDTVKNLSASGSEFQLLYHVNFGTPLLDAGSQFVAPIEEVAPRNEHAASEIENWQNYSAPEAGFEEMVYFMKLKGNEEGGSEALLRNAHGTTGASLKFNIKQLPVFTLWKDTSSLEDGYVTGLEPGTNFPNPRTYEGEKGRVVKLDGGESATMQVSLNFHTNEAEVEAAEKRIALLQGSSKVQVHSSAEKMDESN